MHKNIQGDFTEEEKKTNDVNLNRHHVLNNRLDLSDKCLHEYDEKARDYVEQHNKSTQIDGAALVRSDNSLQMLDGFKNVIGDDPIQPKKTEHLCLVFLKELFNKCVNYLPLQMPGFIGMETLQAIEGIYYLKKDNNLFDQTTRTVLYSVVPLGCIIIGLIPSKKLKNNIHILREVKKRIIKNTNQKKTSVKIIKRAKYFNCDVIFKIWTGAFRFKSFTTQVSVIAQTYSLHFSI